MWWRRGSETKNKKAFPITVSSLTNPLNDGKNLIYSLYLSRPVAPAEVGGFHKSAEMCCNSTDNFFDVNPAVLIFEKSVCSMQWGQS